MKQYSLWFSKKPPTPLADDVCHTARGVLEQGAVSNPETENDGIAWADSGDRRHFQPIRAAASAQMASHEGRKGVV